MGSLHFDNFPCYPMGIWGMRSFRGGGRTDVRTYRWMYGNSPLCPTGHRPFGAAAQKGNDGLTEHVHKTKNQEGNEVSIFLGFAIFSCGPSTLWEAVCSLVCPSVGPAVSTSWKALRLQRYCGTTPLVLVLQLFSFAQHTTSGLCNAQFWTYAMHNCELALHTTTDSHNTQLRYYRLP